MHDLWNAVWLSFFELFAKYGWKFEEKIWMPEKWRIDSFKYTVFFLESFYFSRLKDDKEISRFHDENKKVYCIGNLVDISMFLWSRRKKWAVLVNDIGEIFVEWLEWSECIFIQNIISNAFRRWLADNIHAYIETDESWDYLCIADNGVGIDLEKFSDPNMIFEWWVSGSWSTGVGLRDLEKRWIECSVSNEGLDSMYRGTDKTANDKWALFKMKLNLVKTPTVQ